MALGERLTFQVFPAHKEACAVFPGFLTGMQGARPPNNFPYLAYECSFGGGKTHILANTSTGSPKHLNMTILMAVKVQKGECELA